MPASAPAPAFATGDRVSLHPIEAADYEFLQRGRNAPSTRVPLTNTLIRRREDVADRVQGADHHYLVCATDDRAGEPATSSDDEDGGGTTGGGATGGGADGDDRDGGGDPDRERVGVVAFTRTGSGPKSADLMYWVAPDHRGRGYGTAAVGLFLDYAFRECGFHKVVAQTLVTNEASVAALERLGFEREGRFVDDEFVDGEPVDVFRYAAFADDWSAE